MKKADNFFVRVKKYRKEHPRATQKQAINALKGKKVSGTKKRVTGGIKKITGTRRAAAPVKRKVSGVMKTVTISGTRTLSSAAKAGKYIKDIERLELKRSNEKSREMKDFIQLQINSTHDKLDALKRRYK